MLRIFICFNLILSRQFPPVALGTGIYLIRLSSTLGGFLGKLVSYGKSTAAPEYRKLVLKQSVGISRYAR